MALKVTAQSATMGMSFLTLGATFTSASPVCLNKDDVDQNATTMVYESPVKASNGALRTEATLHISQDDITEWTHSREREFSDLAAKKALKEATPQDLAKFRYLQAHRRRLKNPVDADEVILQYRLKKTQAVIFDALGEYERLSRASNRS